MPELPEVETTRRGIAPHLIGQQIEGLRVRNPHLRWPLPSGLDRKLRGQRIAAIERRGKYLLLRLSAGTLILHLGMSGNLRIVSAATAAGKHDHVDLVLTNGICLRLNDPRRFGAVLWTEDDPMQHTLLRRLGPEPLEAAFTGAYLYNIARGRRSSIKTLLMNAHVVVGVGNIYANEALFRAGIDPRRAAHRITEARYERLAVAVKEVLQEAIRAGGTTLRDFIGSDGEPGRFQLTLQVYGRADQPCIQCGTAIRLSRLGQRATYYCIRCQR